MKTETETPAVTIRPARVEDAQVAAELLCQTMEGLGDYLFGCDPRYPLLEVVKMLFARAENRLSHRFASLADLKGEIAGLLMAYPGEALSKLDLKTGRPLLRLFSLAATIRMTWHALAIGGPEAGRGEYYISNLAVLPRFQGKGIGSRLLAFAEEQARAAGLRRMSLCVDMDNTAALRLYQRTGYHIVLSKLHARRAARAGRGYLRLVKPLAGPAAA